ncbi:MAG: hypothetical protein BAJATHORv1_30307 [Candidatus Thorarchaeota archaeon]|nr:MAG: hypothetical protein BAJATHORv1_30307 [Candidatus Thorarchaeota archaeon]
MPQSEIDSENISRYQRGFEWFTHIVQTDMKKRPWRRLGILTFYDKPYADTENMYLSPKQVILAMAKEAKKKESGLLIVVDALEKGEMGLSTKQGFDQFMEIFDSVFPDSKKYYFGNKASERKWLHEYDSLKIPLEWLIQKPNIFADILSDASPVGEDIGPGDASFENIEGMIEVLVEKLGPPSLTEEVMGKIKSTEASDYAGEAVGLMTVFVSPTTAVSRGVKYLGKFMSLVKDRRKAEVKEVYEEWEKRVQKGYSKENLLKFFELGEDYDAGLDEAISDYKTVLLVVETRNSLYDLFLPLVLQHLVEEIGYLPPEDRPLREPILEEELTVPKTEDWDTDALSYGELEEVASEELPEIEEAQLPKVDLDYEMETDIEMTEADYDGKPETILFLDAATHLSKFVRSFKFALGLPDRYPNLSVSASFYTDKENISDSLEEGVLEYMKERALVFDLHPEIFDDVTARLPITRKAWLMGRLQLMEQIRNEGELAVLEYYPSEYPKWSLRRVDKPESKVVREIRSWFRRGK